MLLALLGCDRGDSGAAQPTTTPPPRPPRPEVVAKPPPSPSQATGAPSAPGPFRFTDIREGSGVDFVHFSGMDGSRHFPTANGSGVAIFDYDGDGRMDLYFANGCKVPLAPGDRGPNRLYRNLGGGRFEDATGPSGLGFSGYCHGVIVGDVDNDGDADVFLCNYGPNALFLNEGNGTFRDVSAAAGVAQAENWSSSAAFLDHDGDGDLDLYVSRYGAWYWDHDVRFCGDPDKKIRRYCSPKELRYAKHSLYRNDGLVDGVPRFTDVADEAGVGRMDGHGFGVATADLDGDGKVDIYVANDQDPNFLFLNNGDGTFRDETEASGAALDAHGRTQAGMGVDAEDVDGDGRPDLFVTNFQDEYNTLYRNLGRGLFLDVTDLFGLSVDSLPWIGWGCGLVDLDNDGWPDLFVANGHIDDNGERFGRPAPYAEPPLLHRNLEGRRFVLANGGAGPYFATEHVGHGAAFGDLDDDGDLDIVVSHKDSPPAILRNDTEAGNRAIRLRLRGTRSNRDALGARVEVAVGDRVIHRQRKGGTSLMSSHDPRLLIGLGPAESADRVTVRWPSGAVSERLGLRAGETHEFVEPSQDDPPSREATPPSKPSEGRDGR